MAKNFLLQFGAGNPSTVAGLSPTFLIFKTVPGGTNVTPPGITQIPSSTGLYYFTYGPTASISFVVDGATTGLANPSRYISGLIDPIDAVDEQLTSVGNSLQAFSASMSVLGASLAGLAVYIGTTASTFGDSTTNPATLFGFLRRLQEFNEGNAIFTKSSGFWSIYSRGSSYLLATKTLADTASNVTKL